MPIYYLYVLGPTYFQGSVWIQNVLSLQLQGSVSAGTKTGPGSLRRESVGVQGNIGKAGTAMAEEALGAATENPLKKIHHRPAWVKVWIQVHIPSVAHGFFLTVSDSDRTAYVFRDSMLQ